MKSIRLRLFSCAAFVLMAAAVAACSGSGGAPVVGGPETTPSPKTTPNATPTPVAANVGAQGGTLVNSDGTGVTIPPGALPDNVTVTVTPTPNAAPPVGAEALGTPTTFGPSGLKFAKPVTVLIAFDPAKLPAGTDVSKVVVYTAPDGTTNYEPLKTTMHDATHVAAETTHFSVFIPVIPPPAPAPSVEAGPSTEDACKPVTCLSLGAGTCGSHSDGCGGALDCGGCPTTVDAGTADPDAAAVDTDSGPVGPSDASTGGRDTGVVDPPDSSVPTDAGATPDGAVLDAGADGSTCKPMLCGSYGPGACGMLGDGCGNVLDCGTCMGGGDAGDPNATKDSGVPMTDAGGGLPDGGACMPLTCGQYGSCGTFPNGCGGMIDCGACGDASGAGADGGAVCKPIINCNPGMCGPTPNGCGGMLDCGPCGTDGGPMPPTDAGACMPVNKCDPMTCGPTPDGCGGMVYCSMGCNNDGGPTPPTDAGACMPVNKCDPMMCGPTPDGCGGMAYCTMGCNADGGGPTPPPDGGACVPVNRCDANSCGAMADGCGGITNCGTCTAPAYCGGGGPNHCGGGTCVPMTCNPMACGPTPDGCGGMMNCSMGCASDGGGGAPLDASVPPG